MNADQALCDEIVRENDYLAGRVLPDGSIACIVQLVTTRAIILGVSRYGWTRRFCYRDYIAMMSEYGKLQTEDDEPQGWIARRPEQPCSRY